MQAFCAGIQSQMAALCGLVAPTPVSYLRLTPNRWAPTVADIARQERGAALRICPTFAGGASRDRQSNVEFRIPDGAANPYLVLTGLIRAGLYGLQQGLIPRPDSAPPLPTSLEEALTALELSPLGQSLAPMLLDAYLRAKRAEATANCDLAPQPLCDLYRRIF
jgi:glutamine synthetase